MKTAATPIQRCACGKTHAQKLTPGRGFEPEPVQRRTISGAEHGFDPAQVHPRVLRPSSGGAPLPSAVQTKMEAAFGHDFSAVRVHHGGEAPSIGAAAFTRGTHLHFAPGRYQPHSAEGQRLLGHELAHVVQQRAGRVARPGGLGINADLALEREADAAGARAASGGFAGVRAAGQKAGTGAAPLQARPVTAGPVIQRVKTVDLSKDDADAYNALRPPSARKEVGQRKYLGLEKLNQALRWVSTMAMHDKKQASALTETQATVHSGQLVMSSNQKASRIAANVHHALSGAGKLETRRSKRHLQRIQDHLVSEEGYQKFRKRMMDEIGAGQGDLPPGATREHAAAQAGPMLETIRSAVLELHQGPNAPSLNVVRGVGGTMHAEQRIYDDIGERKGDVVRDTRQALGYGANEDVPLILPVAGTRRPCNVCHEVEHEASQHGIFENDFSLLRTSAIPGIAYPGEQKITTHAFEDEAQAGAVKARFTAQAAPKSQATEHGADLLDFADDTDSDDDEPAPRPKKMSLAKKALLIGGGLLALGGSYLFHSFMNSDEAGQPG